MAITYNSIGEHYNWTRKADPFLTTQLLKHLNPREGGLYLDIGCGTGNYTNELQKRGYHFIGVDPSKKMLDAAKLQNPEIDWLIGSAEATGLTSNSVDGIIGSLTIHHWSDLKKGFIELKRILKPEARLVLFTSTPAQMKGYWLNHYFPKMLQDSMMQMPSLDLLKTNLSAAGLAIVNRIPYSIRRDLEDQFLYCGKYDPELYFDKHIRHGISSFSSLANRVEVENGLTKLRKDIDNGNIEKVMKSYQNDLGDYLYLIIQKSA